MRLVHYHPVLSHTCGIFKSFIALFLSKVSAHIQRGEKPTTSRQPGKKSLAAFISQGATPFLDLLSAAGHFHIQFQFISAPQPSDKSDPMSREASPVLFSDAPDKTAEAVTTFVPLAECTYLTKQLGGSGQKETMTCDCVEEWDEGKAQNLACGEDSNCINRATSVECVNGLCTCGQNCQNQRFQKKQYSLVKVIQTEKKGYGLVAQADVPEGLFVYEYIGEVIDEKTFRARMLDYDRRNLRHFYFMMLTKDAFIDATEKGSLARFCNHSCLPNAYVDKWVVGDKLRMGIFARRRILAGEEITFDYNVDRYGAQQQPCYCGSPNCMGWIGGKTQTDAALLLPDGISDALGVTRQQEKAWLKQHKNNKSKADKDKNDKSDSGVNDEFVRSLEVEPVPLSDVNKVMGALMKVEDDSLVSKLVERLFLTEDAKVNTAIVRFHGYKTLSKILKQYGTDDELSLRILLILRRWPTMTRNKIELSQIEDVVKQILSTLENQDIQNLAAGLLLDWSKLEMAYRIPKNNDASAREASTGSMSPMLGRNARLELPRDNDAQATGVDLDDDDDLPEGWQKAMDPNTNTVYYYHTGLGISKWERPSSALPTGPKAPSAPQKHKKAEKPRSKDTRPKDVRPKGPRPRNFSEDEFTRLQEEKLQKQKEEQFNGVVEKQKLLQDLILQSQREVEEKKRLEEKLKQEKIEKYKERRRKNEAARSSSSSSSSKVSIETLWTKTLAKYIPNMIKKYEADIGHENIKGCARELVKILAGKETKKAPDTKPPRELDNAKLKKLKEFSKSFMEKFLVKYRAKRAKA